MIPSNHNLPLKIVHNFPYHPDAPIETKKQAVTDYLTAMVARGFGGIVTNVSFHNYTQSPEEWAVLAYAADECERLGLRLWLYDEKGYPSGGAGGLTLAENPDFEATAVVMVKETMSEGETKTIALPRGHQHFLYAAVYAADYEGNLIPDGTGDYPALSVADCRYSTEAVTLKNPWPCPAVALCFIRKRLYEGTHSVHNVSEARRYIDVTNRDAVAAFLRNTYDQYAKHIPEHMTTGAGNPTVPAGQVEAIFTDEPSFMGCYINKGLYPPVTHDPYDDEIPLYPVLSYGRDVENAYFSRYGRDLFPDFIHIFLGDTEVSNSIRYDYYTLMSDLYEESFFTQISDWCARHKVSFSGHLLLEDDIRYHTVFEGNFFSLLRHMHYPGIDMLQSIPSMLCHGIYAFTPKLVSSVAHHYNRPHVMSEVSAHAQGGKVTHDQMYASLCAQYALGVDIFTYYYGETFMDPETYTHYNHALGRIDAIMTGKHKADVLLYYPIETFRRHHKPSDAQYGTYTYWEENCKEALETLMNMLLAYQIDFDFVDGETLSRMKSDGKHLIGANGETYSALILPPMDETVEMKHIFDDLSDKITVLRYRDVAEADEEELWEPLKWHFDGDDPDFCAIRAKTATHGLLRLAKETKDGLACLLVNTNEETVEASFTVYGMKEPVLYDPFEDTLVPCEFVKTDKGHDVNVKLNGLQSLIIRDTSC